MTEIKIGGKKRRVTKRQAMAASLADRLAEGDLTAMRFAMHLMPQLDDPEAKEDMQASFDAFAKKLDEIAAQKAVTFIPPKPKDDSSSSGSTT